MLPVATATYTAPNFQPFYTDAEQINSLMLNLLGRVDGLKVLEPCAGQGAFLRGLSGTPRLVDAVDIDKRHIEQLGSFPSYVNPIHADFIDSFVSGGLINGSIIRNDYDAVICNPPYGLRFSIEYRKSIKRRLPDAYARESYALFMYFAIESLRQGGRYVFIVPDTFLTSRNHRPLREFLLLNGKPSHIIRFPSKRFGTVNFGYGHLCIIAGTRGASAPVDTVLWGEVEDHETPLSETLRDAISIPGTYLIQHSADAWVHPDHLDALKFERPTVQLGELAECRTGIYTGNNALFCAYDASHPPARANGHPIDWESVVTLTPLTKQEQHSGISGARRYVPFMRGGHREPFAPSRSALDWSTDAVEAYRTDKKARLQNHAFYFRPGLAVPMVTSGRLSASYMSGSVFDQGVVGVFPHREDYLPYLLICLNSDLMTQKFKAAINPGANNSANYIKRIPIITPTDDELSQAMAIVERAQVQGWSSTEAARVDFISGILGGA